MIIKVTTIGSNHGGNAIRYAMEKNKKEEKKEEAILKTTVPNKPPFLLASNGIPYSDFITGKPNAHDVWLAMSQQQMTSKHHIKEGYFRIEICPTAEESRGWRPSDWKKLLDDVIRHLDAIDYKNKKGRVVGKHTNIANSQYVAAIHRDTDNDHIHLIVNRITMGDELQDANKIRERGIMAANSLALERGWKTAESIGQDNGAKRKKAIHDDAIEVLRQMNKFSKDEYFKQMRMRGWLVDVKCDSQGVYRGYSIGEQLYKKNGEKSSIVMYQSSKLGFGRDLMVSKLFFTWSKQHNLLLQEQAKKHEEAKASDLDRENKTQEGCVLNSPKEKVVAPEETDKKPVVQHETLLRIPEWKCSTRLGKENWNDDVVEEYRVSDVAYSILDELIKPLDRLSYYDRDDDIPGKAAMMAVAIFEMCTAANVSPISGGGGGNQSDLRWDGKTKDDFEKMAQGAAKRAFGRCTSHLTKRRGMRR